MNCDRQPSPVASRDGGKRGRILRSQAILLKLSEGLEMMKTIEKRRVCVCVCVSFSAISLDRVQTRGTTVLMISSTMLAKQNRSVSFSQWPAYNARRFWSLDRKAVRLDWRASSCLLSSFVFALNLGSRGQFWCLTHLCKNTDSGFLGDGHLGECSNSVLSGSYVKSFAEAEVEEVCLMKDFTGFGRWRCTVPYPKPAAWTRLISAFPEREAATTLIYCQDDTNAGQIVSKTCGNCKRNTKLVQSKKDMYTNS
jgi:hypothetical protein